MTGSQHNDGRGSDGVSLGGVHGDCKEFWELFGPESENVDQYRYRYGQRTLSVSRDGGAETHFV